MPDRWQDVRKDPVLKNYVIFTMLIAICLAGCSGDPESNLPVTPQSVSDQYVDAEVAREALNFVVRTVRSAHPDSSDGFSTATENALSVANGALVQQMSEEDLYFVLNTWLATLQDAHLRVTYRDNALIDHGCIDLAVSWREEGIVVTGGSTALLPGDRITRLGQHTESDLLEALGQVIPVENPFRLKFLGAKRLTRGDYLRWLNVLDNGNVEVTVEAINGDIRRDSLSIHKCPIADTEAEWVGFNIHEEASLGIFWFDRFDYNQEMVDTMELFFEQIDSRKIRKVAVDLRGKDGGDSTVAFAFLEHFSDIEYESFAVDIRVSEELNTMNPDFNPAVMSPFFVEAGMPAIADDANHYVLPAAFVQLAIAGRMNLMSPGDMRKVSGKEIFMLTDAGTYSSGNLFAMLLRDNEIGTLVGEPTGNKVYFNGSELPVDIPDTNLVLNLSTMTMLRPNSSLGDEPAIRPDVAIITTRDDIAKGRDPQLEYLLKED